MSETRGDTRPPTHLRPTGPLGRWSIGSAMAFGLGLIAELLAIWAGQDRGESDTFFDNWWLAGPALVAVIGGVSALVSGALAMTRERDRSIGVVVSTLVGLVVVLFLIFAE